MQTVRIETVVDENGEVRLTRLPFGTGAHVEVTVVGSDARPSAAGLAPLRGVPIVYERPTDPIAEKDWNALL